MRSGAVRLGTTTAYAGVCIDMRQRGVQKRAAGCLRDRKSAPIWKNRRSTGGSDGRKCIIYRIMRYLTTKLADHSALTFPLSMDMARMV